VGCGAGHNSQLLLDLKWSGIGIDLHEESAIQAAKTNCIFVRKGKYRTLCGDFLEPDSLSDGKFDLIISCMVIEHLAEADEEAYFRRCGELLTDAGVAVVLVPASRDHWGVEDETAGHYRRYTCQSLAERLNHFGWTASHITGLTFPVPNLTFKLSNYLIRKNESHKLALSAEEQTKLSGIRRVALKDEFPWYFGAILNETTMLPFHFIQKWFSSHPHCVIVYAECMRQRLSNG
jgi:SAM-dependent methyltransferase